MKTKTHRSIPSSKPKADPFAKELALAAQHGQAGRLAEAKAICEKILSKKPGHSGALHFSGLAALQQGDFAAAIHFFELALKANPKLAEIHQHLGLAYHQMGDYEKGINSLLQAIALRPNSIEGHYNLAMAYAKGCDYDLAEKHYNLALTYSPNHPDILKQLGNLYQEQTKYTEALAFYDKSLAINPSAAPCHYNRAVALQKIDKFNEAVESYQRALLLNPNYDEAENNLGTLLTERDQYANAIKHFTAVLSRNPRFIPSIKNLADAYCKLDKYTEAIALYKQGLAIEPDNIELVNGLVISLKNDCVWDELDHYRKQLVTLAKEKISQDAFCQITPFASLSMWLDFKEQYDVAANHAAHVFKNLAVNPEFKVERHHNSKLRIGYVSADFRDHPVTHLTSGVFEKHHRDRVEVFAYSIGPNDNSVYRERVKQGVDHFVDLFKVPTEQCATRIFEDKIDILIDLMGYTQYARPEIFAMKPAPMQIGYMGYPGTSGTTFMDHYIVDETIVPNAQAHYFSEKLIYLPDTYYPTDNKMKIAEDSPSRQDCGLPENVFVYCCFCTHYKLEPTAFTAWMSILKAVDNSVLWLFSRTASFEENIRAFAQKQGVDPSRIIFAGRQTKEKHLARHQHADLFLDTLIYNAHTTAVDSLWTGLPLVTMLGNSMATRVSASLLKTIELPELVADSLKEYIDLGIYYGKNPAAMQALKNKLAEKIKTAPLFNTELYVNNLETALETVWKSSIVN